MRLGFGVVVLAVTASCATTGAGAPTRAQSSQPTPAAARAAQAPFSAAKIDLELTNSTLTDALAALAGRAQINLFADPHIDDAGRVTLTVHSAPWKDVLARIAAEHQLRVEKLDVRGSNHPSFWISMQSRPPAPVTSFSGARITARFDEAPVRDVAKALSAVAKRTIVVDDDVQVNITLHLRLP